MTDRTSLDAFELRLTAELERYVAAATDTKPAADIADVAMRPRSLGSRARNVSTRRRMLVLGVAAAFLVPAALIGAGSFRHAPAVPEPLRPTATLEAQPTSVPSQPAGGSAAIFVRRVESPAPGVAIVAVGANGSERLIRTVPDTVVANGKLAAWGTVGRSGWIALGLDQSSGGSWPMVVVDLHSPDSAPWIVTEANIGGIGPRWGPNGLVAAYVGGVGPTGGGDGPKIVIADPATRSTRLISMNGGLIGGGPTIIWTADGSAIVGSGESGYHVVPVDGGPARTDIGAIFDPSGGYGDGLARLQLCTHNPDCRGQDDGRVERVGLDGSVRTVWHQTGPDRVLSAAFGVSAGEYWLSVDHSGGRQIGLIHVHEGRSDTVGAINRDRTWQYVGAPTAAPDGSMAVVWLDIGAKAAAVVVPLDGSSATYRAEAFAGFADTTVLASSGPEAPGQTLSPVGEAYRLPSLDELVAAELSMNPGERVLGKATHDAVEGDAVTRTTEVTIEAPGGSVYLDCLGPASATVKTSAGSTTSPCLSAGSYVMDAGSTSPITVTARGDTTWRVVVYAPAPQNPGATAPPEATAP